MYHPFSITETLSIAWHILVKNIATIAVYALIAYLILFGLWFLIEYIFTDDILKSIGTFFLIISISFLFLGFIKLVFRLIDKEFYEFGFMDIVPKIKMWLSYIILLVIVSTIAVFMTNAINKIQEGLLQSLLGLITYLFFQFFFLFYFPICACFIVDDESGPFESVSQSFHLIKGNFVKYFLLFLLIESLAFIGIVTRIGIWFVLPIVNILLVVAYRKLVYSQIDADDEFVETI